PSAGSLDVLTQLGTGATRHEIFNIPPVLVPWPPSRDEPIRRNGRLILGKSPRLAKIREAGSLEFVQLGAVQKSRSKA
ncbi:hypothetical protein, partial [Salmonella enterica]|uniref:hypothetical protein n=1 Tax=Salmonella enterica TaxID=28901 RepID=UPI0020C43B40